MKVDCRCTGEWAKLRATRPRDWQTCLVGNRAGLRPSLTFTSSRSQHQHLALGLLSLCPSSCPALVEGLAVPYNAVITMDAKAGQRRLLVVLLCYDPMGLPKQGNHEGRLAEAGTSTRERKVSRRERPLSRDV